MAPDTFNTAAQTGFQVLWDFFIKPDVFKGNLWFAGNTFHTCLDYLLNAKITDPKVTSNIVTTGYKLYDGLYPGDWWRDDYGWWGDSFVLAIENRGKLGLADSQYDDVFNSMASAAAYCWLRMNNVWSDEPYGVPPDHAGGTANIRGGIYNIPGLTCDSDKFMQGRNSVSNEGYWLLSLGLQRLFPSPAYQQAAAAMGTWVQQFLARTPVCNDPNGLVGLLDTSCHVLERPMGNEFIPSWYWTGDQGLLSRGLVESNTQPARAVQIVDAAIASMTDDENVLHENLAFTNVTWPDLSQFLADYATGKGIFMRSLRAVNSNGAYTKFIVKNATEVWCKRHTEPDKLNQFTFNWDRNFKKGYEDLDLSSKHSTLDQIITQAAGLDALNAALLVVPPDTPITC